MKQGKKVAAHRPRPRVIVDAETWLSRRSTLVAGDASPCSGCGATRPRCIMALLDEDGDDFAVLSFDVQTGGAFPRWVQRIRRRSGSNARSTISSALKPTARRIRAPGSITASMAGPSARQTRRRTRLRLPFLPAKGEHLHQIPVGPVHAGIIEPGHFRFTANGETVVRLEERLGYVHKGIEKLMAGAVARSTPPSSPAGSRATARSPMPSPSRGPPRRRWTSRRRRARHYLRALMAELERLANHFGDIGAICNDASLSPSCTPIAACCASACCAPPTPLSATG